MSAPFVEAAFVFMVTVVVVLPPAAIMTLAGLRLQAGRLCAPAGETARAQVRFMVPEYVLPADKKTSAEALSGPRSKGPLLDLSRDTTHGLA